MLNSCKIFHKRPGFILIAFILLNNVVAAQAPSLYWEQYYGGSKIDFLGLILKTTDTGYVIGGHGQSTDGDFNGINNGSTDFEVLKLDVCGRKIWSNISGGNALDLLYSIKETKEHGFLLSGYTTSTNLQNGYHGGASDAIVVKLDANGNTLWLKTFGGSNVDFLHNSIFLADSSCMIVGCTTSTNGDGDPQAASKNGWVLKLDKNGNVLWKKFFGNTGSILYDIVASDDGGFFICGTITIAGFSNVLLVKIDDMGNQLWENNYGGSGAEFPYSMKKTMSGGYMLICNTKSNDGDVTGNHGDQDAWVVCVDGDGNLLWQKCMGGSALELMRSLAVLADGTYVFSGYSNSVDGDITQNTGMSVGFAFCLENTGGLIWTRCYGGSNRDEFYGAESSPDGSVWLSGITSSSDGDISGNHSSGDFMLLKLLNKITRTIDTVQCSPVMINNVLFTRDTVYVDTLQDICNYDSAFIRYNITIQPESVRSINDTTIHFREQVVLTTTASGPITWIGQGLSCYTCLSPIANPANRINQYIVKTGSGNCTVADTVIINVKPTDTLFVPTAFTPNGDGKNDIFNALGVVTDFYMEIYNRWGERVFSTNSLLTGWDGTNKGIVQASGTFAYYIRYKNQSDKIKELKGTISLIR
ncbi:MAG TPA: gliding motility-associated C-terminal domain-containing protein [Chitinophagaceae bacterium]|nr:gliding motility-associated C-terminal domain-containing protein [Chitinophagaceae bacterium]